MRKSIVLFFTLIFMSVLIFLIADVIENTNKELKLANDTKILVQINYLLKDTAMSLDKLNKLNQLNDFLDSYPLVQLPLENESYIEVQFIKQDDLLYIKNKEKIINKLIEYNILDPYLLYSVFEGNYVYDIQERYPFYTKDIKTQQQLIIALKHYKELNHDNIIKPLIYNKDFLSNFVYKDHTIGGYKFIKCNIDTSMYNSNIHINFIYKYKKGKKGKIIEVDFSYKICCTRGNDDFK